MKTLETERLKLRKFSPDDLDAVHSYAGCADNLIYMMWGPNSKENTQAFIDTAIAEAEKEPCHNYHYAVVLKESSALIGGCNLSLDGDTGEVGWLLHRDFWRRGFGSEIGRALLEFGFEELGLYRITAHCDAENIASYGVMEKIGMRREGLFLESRPANKKSSRKYSDELSYAILRDEWEIKKEIEYYNSLPCRFEDFIELPDLTDGEIELVCAHKHNAIPEKKYVPDYIFEIRKNKQKIGSLSLRIGYTEGLYYGGNIGYGIDEPYRGNGYAAAACRLAVPVARAHGMTKLLISNDVNNHASRRVCEKLGLRLVREVRLPEWTELYRDGERYINIFEWSID